MDVHSFSRPDQVRVRHLELEFDLRFDRKIVDGSVTLHFEATDQRDLVLDTRDLQIHAVENATGFELGARDPILGSPLKIGLEKGCSWVRVRYSTTPGASGRAEECGVGKGLKATWGRQPRKKHQTE